MRLPRKYPPFDPTHLTRQLIVPLLGEISSRWVSIGPTWNARATNRLSYLCFLFHCW